MHRCPRRACQNDCDGLDPHPATRSAVEQYKREGKFELKLEEPVVEEPEAPESTEVDMAGAGTEDAAADAPAAAMEAEGEAAQEDQGSQGSEGNEGGSRGNSPSRSRSRSRSRSASLERSRSRSPSAKDRSKSPEKKSEPDARAAGKPCFLCGKEGHFKRDCPERRLADDAWTPMALRVCGPRQCPWTQLLLQRWLAPCPVPAPIRTCNPLACLPSTRLSSSSCVEWALTL